MTLAVPRVLVAEDEAIIRMDLVETLVQEGYDVVASVSDGETAVERILAESPDVALIDIAMPGLDGIEVTRRTSETTAIVVVTAFGQREHVTQARDAGAMAYVVKPVGRDDLVPAIEMAWSGWLTLRELRGQVSTSAAAAEHAEQRLAQRRDVDRAKGILTDALGMSEEEAYRWLRQEAMDSRRSIVDVAAQVLRTPPGPFAR